MNSFAKKTTQFIQQQALWQERASLVVAVSGGPDSRALLHLLCHLQPKYALSLRVAHVNYHLRGTDSEADEQLVRALARQYALPCSVLCVRLRPEQANLEARLRDIRYRFFERLRARQAADVIALGHTADDQAETLIIHLLQGSGLRGLRGMLPRSRFLARPLLWARRTDILAYCDREGLEFRHDATNDNPQFLRNRIRHELLPLLAARFNPNIHHTLARSAAVIAQEYTQLYPDLPEKQ